MNFEDPVNKYSPHILIDFLLALHVAGVRLSLKLSATHVRVHIIHIL
jgi:hypothetical protein